MKPKRLSLIVLSPLNGVYCRSHMERTLRGITHCMTDYMNFCMDIVVPVITVRCFADNKPWITSNVKGLLNKKKRAFKDNNQEELRSVQR